MCTPPFPLHRPHASARANHAPSGPASGNNHHHSSSIIHHVHHAPSTTYHPTSSSIFPSLLSSAVRNLIYRVFMPYARMSVRRHCNLNFVQLILTDFFFASAHVCSGPQSTSPRPRYAGDSPGALSGTSTCFFIYVLYGTAMSKYRILLGSDDNAK